LKQQFREITISSRFTLQKRGKEKLAKLIEPYIIESMSYKIKNWIPKKSCELRETPH
jgi:hypothetical protein